MERNLKELSFDDIKQSCKRLAQQIKEKGWKIDVIVPLLKGGMTPAVFIGKELDIDNYACLHTRTTLSNKANAECKEPISLGFTNVEEIKGKNVLVVDDIYDTGRSIKFANEVVKQNGAKNIYNALCITVNEETKSLDNMVCDLDYIKEHYWIVFPWE